MSRDLKEMAGHILEESEKLIEELLANGMKASLLEPIRGVIKTRTKHVMNFWGS